MNTMIKTTNTDRFNRKSTFILCLSLVGLSSLNLTYAADWQFDLSKTSVTFVTPSTGLTQVRGHFNKFDGQIIGNVFDQKHLRVNFTVQTDSVSTGLGMRDSTLKGSSLFNADKYPTAVFKSTGVTQIDPAHLVMQGDLTMLGITKPLDVKVTLGSPEVDPVTKSLHIGTTADSTISRSKWGMTSYSTFIGDDIAVHMVGVMTSNNVNPEELVKILKH
jgi:polyisoprenoid-binding protein YceI